MPSLVCCFRLKGAFYKVFDGGKGAAGEPLGGGGGAGGVGWGGAGKGAGEGRLDEVVKRVLEHQSLQVWAPQLPEDACPLENG